MRRVLLLVGLLVLASVAVTSSGGAVQAQPGWVVTELGGFSGPSWAVAINDRGQIVVNSGDWDAPRALLWEQERFRNLGTLGGHSTTAVSINERGHIVGWSDTKSGDPHAFIWQNGRMRDLGTMGRGWSFAVGINDRSQVIGFTSADAGERPRAFLWERGRMRDLGTLGSKAPIHPVAINNRGEVVGTEGGHAEEHAFVWEQGKMRALGTLGGKYSIVYAINDRGQIVGRSRTGQTPDPWLAAMWSGKRILGLGPKSEGYEPVAINERGQVSGSGWPAAFFWTDGSLRTFGDSNTVPTAINQRGQVVGYRSTSRECDNPGMRGENVPRAFVWANGMTTLLPTLRGGTASSPGAPPAVSLFSDFAPGASANAVNGRGQIVGWSTTSSGDYCFDGAMHSVLWTLKR